MCTGIETALLVASLASTAGGVVMNNRAQQSSMKRYNEQVTAQNRLLSDQFADKQKQINAGKEAQGKLFNEIGAEQDAEFARQKQLADEKSKAFQEAAKQPTLQGANSPEYEQAVNNRMKLFTDTSTELPGNFGVSNNGSTENRVLRTLADKDRADSDATTTGIANAQARIAAMGDSEQAQDQLFRDLGVTMGDYARKADSSSRLLSSKLRLPEYRMGAISGAMGEAANTPYFRGQEPVYRTPNTLFGDILTGAGQLGQMYMYRQPKTATAKTWVNPDLSRA